MDSKTWLSSLGESRVVSELIRQGYDVFTQLSGKSPIDLVAYKDGKLSRVQVKSTGQRTKHNTGWTIEMKSTRSNRTSNVIHNFNNNSCDLLAIYIEPIDKVLLIDSKEIKVRCALVITDKKLEGIRLDEEPVLKTGGP